MRISSLLFVVLGVFSINVFASDVHSSNHPRMCLSAYLAKPIHVGDITFYVKNEPIGNTSIHGAWVQIVGMIDYGYFKDQKDFEEKKKFLRVENIGKKLVVNKYTYESC